MSELMTFFFGDGRVERHLVDAPSPVWRLVERIFVLTRFDRHLRCVGSEARWVYVEGGHFRKVLVGAEAAQAIGLFIACAEANGGDDE